MISVVEARRRILAALRPGAPEIVGLAQAHGRVLAKPVQARLTVPPADISAMDGYALRVADATPGSRLKLVGEAPAGHPFSGQIGAGEVVRIFTGSVIPAGADTVLIQENATAEADAVVVNEAVVAGRHIRRAGQDFSAGDEVLHAGRRLSVRDVAVAGAAGYPWLCVYRKPRVAILCTGDEIALPGEPVPAGGIANSNASMLMAFASAHGGEPLLLPIARDTEDAVAEAALAARGADMLVTTGGASVGAHDLVQSGLARHGFALDFWKIAMRPGKPLIFGQVNGLPVLGLPGNPVSAYVCASLFLAGAIAVLGGLDPQGPVFETVTLGASMKPNDTREDYVRATLTRAAIGWVATPLPVQDSGMLTALSRAGALIRRPPNATAAAPGDEVEILRLGLS
ncbi:molybdopterin molybdotransferase MoeA [Acidocella aminolytica]|jgi:molybdopterin molybdotransferase|uniref:Molybdopterin molybdenumtransferase n=1 Tax=Acidocella aminolytica 101 = DSM 11237 TaxID=1120923 RepID=A0A0D6PG95_9PROT|nr:gephyrin-like molybdotransferase Glp [Acidocella aminolytica]GAN80223.1 molybdopterin biosynthesis protein MoeA [Acidocella aminolytica 101 = DSM 11237]GBQ37196.1 molybdopterin biosynthesis protein MoeA [Acidocella aminolytica 101 = DSM 11237]SHF30076.1 molybdopterin molybdochelatase [Acidocella aminolytica 101 = DSM 11237]